jgi:hypothetical protein
MNKNVKWLMESFQSRRISSEFLEFYALIKVLQRVYATYIKNVTFCNGKKFTNREK